MTETYEVKFTDCNGYYNHRILLAISLEDLVGYLDNDIRADKVISIKRRDK